jgi:hypothetical protein
MANQDRQDLGYAIVKKRDADEGHIRSFAVFTCSNCSATIEFKQSNGRATDPEFFAKRATQLGWVAFPRRHQSSTYCPKCRGPNKRAPVDTKEDPMPPPTTLPTAPPSMLLDSTPVPSVMPGETQPVLKMPTKELTADQRFAIRDKLEHYFDDKVGGYLENYSDQRIAELCGVPRMHVERIREAAFGPIRVDEEAQKLQTDIVAFTAAIEAHQKGLDKLKTQAATLVSRVAAHLAKGVP